MKIIPGLDSIIIEYQIDDKEKLLTDNEIKLQRIKETRQKPWEFNI